MTSLLALLIGCGGGGGAIVPPPEGGYGGATLIGTGADDLWFLDVRLGAEQATPQPDVAFVRHWDGASWSEAIDVVEEIEDGMHPFTPWIAADDAGAVLVGDRDRVLRVAADGSVTPDALGGEMSGIEPLQFVARDGVRWVSTEGGISRDAGAGWEALPEPPATGTIVPVSDEAIWLVPDMAYWDGSSWGLVGPVDSQFGLIEQRAFAANGQLYAMLDEYGNVLRCSDIGCEIVGIDLGDAVVDGIYSAIPDGDGVAILTVYSNIADDFDRKVVRKFEAWPVDFESATVGGSRTVAAFDDRCDAGCAPISYNASAPHLADGSVTVGLADGIGVVSPSRR